MVEEKSRIRRLLYSLNIRKTFIPIRRFAKPKEDPFAAIRTFFESLVPKPKEEMKFEGKIVKARAPIFRTILYIVIALVLLGLAVYIITNIKIESAPPIITALVLPAPVIKAEINDAGFLDSYDGQRWYATASIGGLNLDYANLSLSVYKDFAPEDVFILRSAKKEATRYNDFKKILKSSLESNGISVTEITIDDLLRMPKDLKITLIVPSGYLPTFFIGIEDPQFDIKKFTQNGNVVVYIGRSPTTDGLIARSGDITRVDSDKIGKDFGLSFLAESQPYEMFKPLYRVQEIARGQSGLSLISAVGSASVTWGSGGYVYFLPTTLDGWWSTSGNASALYVANIVSNAAWGYYYASGNSDIQAVNGTLGTINISIFTNKLVQRVDAGMITQANGRLFIKTDKINDSVKAGKMVQFQFQAAPNGRIDNLDIFSSSSITGKDLSLTYSLNESVLREEEVFLEVWNSSGTNVRTMPIGRISLQVSQAGFPFPATLPSGNYILKIVDPAGTSLAQSYLHLAPFTIEPQSLGWDLKLFIFNVFAEGETKTPYLGEIRPVKISLDGTDEKEVKLINGKLSYESTFFPGPGKHVFKFVIGDDAITKEINFVREPSFIEKYWYMILTIIVVFGIAFGIRRPEKAEFSVDVPDFPPLHAIAIPIKRETILAMFSSINKELRWEYTPLSLQDLKTGFRKMSYQGRPVIVGDYNLEHILDRLVEEGQLKHAIDYYGLVSWERESKMSIYRLAMQRALRDLFVIEGIPFIPFGQKTDCDTVVSFGGEKVMLHIYEDDSIINKAVQTASQGRSIIVFEDEQTMKDFTARIHSSSETNVIFKILLDDANGNIFLSPINKLVDTLDKKYSLFYY